MLQILLKTNCNRKPNPKSFPQVHSRQQEQFKLLVLVYQAVHHVWRVCLSYVIGDTIRTHSLTEIHGSPFFDNTAVQPRAVWSAGLFCGGSIIVEQSTAHHKRSRRINNI